MLGRVHSSFWAFALLLVTDCIIPCPYRRLKCVHGEHTDAAAPCSTVEWNPGALPGHCHVLDTVCVDQGSRIVTHSPLYQIENVSRQNLPVMPVVSWNLPIRVNVFPDALGGWQPGFQVVLRPASKAEPTHALRHPSWSNCTLPVILLVDYPYNYKTFLVKVLADVDTIFRVNNLAPRRDATLVLATPSGLALEPYHATLLSPYSSRPLVTLSELGRRGMEGLPADWTGEGIRAHCFSKLVICSLDRQDRTPLHVPAAAVLSHLGAAVPPDPLGFGAEDPAVLRVVVEERRAPWRTIRNVPDILKACEEANVQGFSVGPFKRIVCKALTAAYSTDAAEPGAIPPDAPAAAAFRTALGAVRSAHLFVALAGSSGAHAFFMRPDAAGLLEVRPCGWGSQHSNIADEAQDSMATQLGADNAIRFFALNVEQPSQCSPPDYAPQAEAAKGSMKPEATAHPFQVKPKPRYSVEQLLARDQHVTLRPHPLLAMIRHSAGLLADKAAYQAARDASRLHGYAVEQGVLLGPLGVKDAPQRAQAAQPEELLRA